MIVLSVVLSALVQLSFSSRSALVQFLFSSCSVLVQLLFISCSALVQFLFSSCLVLVQLLISSSSALVRLLSVAGLSFWFHSQLAISFFVIFRFWIIGRWFGGSVCWSCRNSRDWRSDTIGWWHGTTTPAASRSHLQRRIRPATGKLFEDNTHNFYTSSAPSWYIERLICPATETSLLMMRNAHSRRRWLKG